MGHFTINVGISKLIRNHNTSHFTIREWCMQTRFHTSTKWLSKLPTQCSEESRMTHHCYMPFRSRPQIIIQMFISVLYLEFTIWRNSCVRSRKALGVSAVLAGNGSSSASTWLKSTPGKFNWKYDRDLRLSQGWISTRSRHVSIARNGGLPLEVIKPCAGRSPAMESRPNINGNVSVAGFSFPNNPQAVSNVLVRGETMTKSTRKSGFISSKCARNLCTYISIVQIYKYWIKAHLLPAFGCQMRVVEFWVFVFFMIGFSSDVVETLCMSDEVDSLQEGV